MTTRFPSHHRGGGGSRPISPPVTGGVIGIGSSWNNAAATSRLRRVERSLNPSTTVSDFSLSVMPRDKIVRRTLHPWTVRYSLTTHKWVATISRPAIDHTMTITASTRSSSNSTNLHHSQFMFDTERHARKFCWSFSPPKLSNSLHCQLCTPPTSTTTTIRQSTSCGATLHCRNCGVTICDSSSCSTKWGNRMVPKMYLRNNSGGHLSSSPSSVSSHHSNIGKSMVVRVCKSCDWLSNAFCMALIQGRYQDALILYDTGNVNLRTCFADINKEAMFPIHCAVMGGSLDLVQWLVDVQLVPIVGPAINFRNQSQQSQLQQHVSQQQQQVLQSVQTSASRTLLDLAMTGRPKVEILMYLIAEKELRINDVKDPQLAPKTLETLMKSSSAGLLLLQQQPGGGGANVHVIMDNGAEQEDSVMSNPDSMEDACHICFERQMDCVLIPCGHQVCCIECAEQLRSCPICKVKCSVVRVFRQ